LKRKIGMEAAYNVELGNGLRVPGGGGFESFFERHGVGAGRVFFAAEGTEAAGRDADVRRIDVAVDVEIRLVAMQALAHVVRKPADGEDVAGAVEGECVSFVEALADKDFVLDCGQARIVGLERMRHTASIIAQAWGEVTVRADVRRFQRE
jgi:hypothetical protein